MNYKFFYKLGHQKDLGVAEFQSLTKETNLNYDELYLLANSYLNVRDAGSLVYGGRVLSFFNSSNFDVNGSENLSLLLQTISSLGLKKVGIQAPKNTHYRLLKLAKQAGVKKLNILRSDQHLNYGHWKQTKNWFIFDKINNQSFFGQIDSFSDQEFWQNLDTKLPHGEMSRGLINLKLARTLLNLSEQKMIWDPFCGFGRVFAAGLDLKSQFFGSDVDGNFLAKDIQENYKFALEYWSKYGFFQRKIENYTLAQLSRIQALDARNLTSNCLITEDSYQKLAIVTEGFLGTNFKSRPSESEINSEWEKLAELWSDALLSASQLKIPEIVFCLPFYIIQGKKLLPEFIFDVVQGSNYKALSLGDKKYLLYSRKDTITGHFILKILKN